MALQDHSVSAPLRVALFTDSFQEANGVATLSRQFAEFAQFEGLPFCCVHGGAKTQATRQGSLLTLEMKRSMVSFPMDKDLYCDFLLNRYRNRIVAQVGAFNPDLIHITGPGDVGILGFWVSHLLHVPMVASWHTNLHEYAARRLYKFLSFAPFNLRTRITAGAENQSLRALTAFYRLAHFTLAPNRTMVDLLHARTGRPSYLMGHGVDIERFSPSRRSRKDGCFSIGYVGRLTAEKNVRAFAALERGLLAAGENNFRFLLVGEGGEREWLRRNIRSIEMPGVLRGECLAKAFADMDAFVFPSRTDTFGLVVLEAMASGVPVVTSPETGSRIGVRHGVTGLLIEDFAAGVLELIRDEPRRLAMACEARRFASAKSWRPVFQDVYNTYELALNTDDVRRRMPAKLQLTT